MTRIISKFTAVLLLIAAIGIQSPGVFATGSKLGLDDQAPNQVQAQTQVQTSTPAAPKNDNPLVNAANSQSNEGTQTEVRSWVYEALSIFGRLLLAVGLSSVLAFRPRQDVPLFKRSLFVSQTQILL